MIHFVYDFLNIFIIPSRNYLRSGANIEANKAIIEIVNGMWGCLLANSFIGITIFF